MDKPPPHNDEAERSVVGSLLISPDSLDVVVGWLEPDCFYNKLLGRIYQAICDLSEAGTPVDLLTVKDEMRTRGEDPSIAVTVSGLTDGIPDIANIAHYAHIVSRDHKRRTAIKMCEESSVSFWNDSDIKVSAGRLLDAAADLLEDTDDDRVGLVDSSQLAKSALRGVEKRMSGDEGTKTAIPTGFFGVDAHMDGWTRGVISVVGGREGEGKTAWVLQTAINAAKAGYHVLFVSLDMSRELIQDRLLSMVSGVDSSYIKRGNKTTGGLYGNLSQDELIERLTSGARELSSYPGSLRVTDETFDVAEIVAECRTLARKRELDLLFVDYAQMVESSTIRSEKEHLRLGAIIRRLKQSVATRHNVAVVLLSQFNKTLQPGERPSRYHLAETSDLARAARNVFLVWRPGQYASTKELPCKTTLILDKASEYGSTDFDLHFVGHCFQFEEQLHDERCVYYDG